MSRILVPSRLSDTSVEKYRSLRRGDATRAIGSKDASGAIGGSYIGYDDQGIPETNRSLQGALRFHAFRSMIRTVPVCAALFRLLQGIGSKATLSLATEDVPESLLNRQTERLDMVMSTLQGVSMADVQANMIEAITHGYSLQEPVLTNSMGVWSLLAVNKIPQTTIYKVEHDRAQQVSAFVQYTPRSVTIPRAKCLYVKSGAGDWGNGMLMDAAELALHFINHLRLVMRGREQNIRNVPDFPVPDDVFADASNAYRTSVMQQLGESATAIGKRYMYPSNVQIGDDSSGGDRLIATPQYSVTRPDPVPFPDNDRLVELDKEIAIQLGVEALTLGVDGAGSLALSRSQLSTTMQIVDGGLQRGAEEWQRFLSEIWRLNGWAEMPEIVVDRSGWLDQQGAAEILGAVKDVPVEIYGSAIDEVLEQSGLPPRDTEAAPMPMPTGDGDDGNE